MNETHIKPHWSFWVICVIALIWNLMGSINFTMQMDPEMLANYPDEAKSLVETRPFWATIAFAIAVFGGLLGDIFLILRKAIAYYLFIASLVGVIVTNIHTFQVSGAIDILIGSLMSVIVAAFLIWYAALVKGKEWIK